MHRWTFVDLRTPYRIGVFLPLPFFNILPMLGKTNYEKGFIPIF